MKTLKNKKETKMGKSKFVSLIGKRVLVKWNEEYREVGLQGYSGFSGLSGTKDHPGPKGKISLDNDLMIKNKVLIKKELNDFLEFRPLELSMDKKYIRCVFGNSYNTVTDQNQKYGNWHTVENVDDALEIVTIID